MVQYPIYESDAKTILKKYASLPFLEHMEHVVVDDLLDLDTLPLSNKWVLEKKLVVKPDQCIKGRGLSGLVGLDLTFDQVRDWLKSHFNEYHQIGRTHGQLNRFIIEPFMPHISLEEHYLCIMSEKEGDRILYSSCAGIDIGDVISHAKHITVHLTKLANYSQLLELFSGCSSKTFVSHMSQLVVSLLKLFRDLHLTYLELNPVIYCSKRNCVSIVDVAAKIDTCAEFLCAERWDLSRMPPVFGREQSESERYIGSLDAKSGASLKFVLLNKDARVWTMVAGGGASVVFSDTICDLGFASEMANYGEYSGAPTLDETYQYASTILNLMTSSLHRPEGKVLIVGGGIANFTNVASTFKGIIKAIRETAKLLVQHRVQIFVRRGGPNYEEGLKNFHDACTALDITVFVFGIDVHMTSIVAMALGATPVSGTMCFNTSDTVSLPSRAALVESELVEANGSASPKLASSLTPLFTNTTTAIIWGFQEIAIQGMLDFDYLCGRAVPSVCCMIYPFRASCISKFYFGLQEIFIPIYGTFKEATDKFPEASVLINFASMRSSYEVSLEALAFSQFNVLSVFAEGIPERQTQLLNIKAKAAHVTVIGPASVGGIKPGSFRIGHAGGIIGNISSSKLYRPGSVCYITRSGGMANELNNVLVRTTDGVYEGVHLGGDRFPGTSYMDHLPRFCADPEVELIVILGEVGGWEEYTVCEALKSGSITKPLIAWCIGTCSSYFDTHIQFGHANASADSQAETASAKNEALRSAGAIVPSSFDELFSLISSVYLDRVEQGLWKRKPEVSPPPIPVDYKFAREMGLIRKPTAFISTICDDRGDEPVYSGCPVSRIVDEDLGIGAVIGLLWFQRILPPHMTKFLETCIIVLADHGPAVSGAHNTIVTARAGKDMLSSLCSGLLTIGDRFGGAINGAASQFWGAFTEKLSPNVFVQNMRKKGELILGIGHRVKSVSNPDMRVKKLISFVKSVQSTPILDYALEVERITTSKKSNLILNVDGAIAVCLIDMMLHSDSFTENDVKLYIQHGAFNAIFILSRTIGFIGHFLDQKRLKQGLYRHDWDDISFLSCFDLGRRL